MSVVIPYEKYVAIAAPAAPEIRLRKHRRRMDGNPHAHHRFWNFGAMAGSQFRVAAHRAWRQFLRDQGWIFYKGKKIMVETGDDSALEAPGPMVLSPPVELSHYSAF